MARRRNDISVVEARVKEGRGQGRGRDYTPWLTVRDVPSHGLAHRLPGHVANREHHLFSTLEADVLYLLDWSPAVSDIREQFPLLPVEETLRLAEHLGVRHPVDPKTKLPIVMTTDFLVTRHRDGGITEEAYAVKPSSDVEGTRTLEKLDIERAYWLERGIRWSIVTERELPRDRIANLRWLHTARAPEGLGVPSASLHQIIAHLDGAIAAAPRDALAAICLREDERLGFSSSGTCLAVVRHALAAGYWSVDLSIRIDPTKPLARVSGQHTTSEPAVEPAAEDDPPQRSAA